MNVKVTFTVEFDDDVTGLGVLIDAMTDELCSYEHVVSVTAD